MGLGSTFGFETYKGRMDTRFELGSLFSADKDWNSLKGTKKDLDLWVNTVLTDVR